ncbi:hypothetical protein CFR73_06340 [Novacetimonas maltaceti]|nr:hypothetical protein CFR73_06340 [Novacetimonas maltaceti]
MQAVIGAAHPDGNMDIISKNFTAITFDQKNHLKTVISTDLKPNFVLFACGKEKKNLSKDFLIGTENDKYALYPTNDETNAEIMNLMTTCSMVLISIGPENKFYVILLDGMKRALDSLTTIKGIPFDVGNKDPEFPLATEDGKPFVYPDGGAH